MKKRVALGDRLLAILLLVFVVITVKLGFWQLSRADEKTQLQARIEARQHQASVAFNFVAMQQPEHAFRNVTLQGEVDNTQTFLLDNSVRDGKAGYEVFSPLTTAQGVVMINRGWVVGNPDRRQLPTIPVLHEQTFSGYVYVPLQAQTVDATKTPLQWPQVISDIDMAFIGSRLHQAVFPYTIRVQQGGDTVFLQRWMVANMPASKHIAYAVQWFLIALLLAGLAIYISIPRGKQQDES